MAPLRMQKMVWWFMNGKGQGKVVPLHSMKILGEWRYSSEHGELWTRWMQVVIPRAAISRWIRGLVGPGAYLDFLEKSQTSCPDWKSKQEPNILPRLEIEARAKHLARLGIEARLLVFRLVTKSLYEFGFSYSRLLNGSARARVCVCVCMYVCMYVRTYVCIYVGR